MNLWPNRSSSAGHFLIWPNKYFENLRARPMWLSSSYMLLDERVPCLVVNWGKEREGEGTIRGTETKAGEMASGRRYRRNLLEIALQTVNATI